MNIKIKAKNIIWSNPYYGDPIKEDLPSEDEFEIEFKDKYYQGRRLIEMAARDYLCKKYNYVINRADYEFEEIKVKRIKTRTKVEFYIETERNFIIDASEYEAKKMLKDDSLSSFFNKIQCGDFSIDEIHTMIKEDHNGEISSKIVSIEPIEDKDLY